LLKAARRLSDALETGDLRAIRRDASPAGAPHEVIE